MELSIKNFGAIRNGKLKLKQINVFSGKQGTGKTSCAKLIAILANLEKQLYLKTLPHLNYLDFLKYCKYYNIEKYINPNTEIYYKGQGCQISLKEKTINYIVNTQNYLVPKIIYIPCERNIFSVLPHPERIKGLSLCLSAFLEEFKLAEREILNPLILPIFDVPVWFNELKNRLLIHNHLTLQEVNSCLQSFIPMYLITRYNTLIIEKRLDPNNLTGEAKQKIKDNLAQILLNPNMASEIKEASLRLLSLHYKNDYLLNIVDNFDQNIPNDYKLLVLNELKNKGHLIVTCQSLKSDYPTFTFTERGEILT